MFYPNWFRTTYKRSASLRSAWHGAAVWLAGTLALAGAAAADAPTSASLSKLYSFSSTSTSSQSGAPLIGYTPHGLSAAPGNLFYGLTQSGGPNGAGNALCFNANTGVSTVLYPFASGTGPDDTLTAGLSSTLYGTLAAGGANSSGAVYSLAADGSQYTTLHDFTALDGSGYNGDGSYPTGSLLQGTGGRLYGEAQLGGANAAGVLYALHPAGRAAAAAAARTALSLPAV